MLLTVSRTTMKREQDNANKCDFLKTDNDSKYKNWFQIYFKIYSRSIAISVCLLKWNVKKNYWIFNWFKIKKKNTDSTSWVYTNKIGFWR